MQFIKKFNVFNAFNEFDAITQFRLLNSFIFAIGFNLLVPVLIELKGECLTAWGISVFLIGEQLIVKTNRYISSLSIDTVYHLGILTHLLFICSALLYFINTLYMVLAEGVVSIIVVAVFGAYSIKLNTYLAETYPKSMTDFQILRNSTWANGLLIGLLCCSTLTYFINNSAAIIAFIIWNSFFTIWMISNWNFYSNHSDIS